MSHFDLFDGEGLEFEHIQRLQGEKRQIEQQEKLRQQQEKLAHEQNRERERISRLPRCPYCGGRLEGKFELCMHCRSKISWVEDKPCKPGEEAAIARHIHQEREESHLRQEAAEMAKWYQRSAAENKKYRERFIQRWFWSPLIIFLTLLVGGIVLESTGYAETVLFAASMFAFAMLVLSSNRLPTLWKSLCWLLLLLFWPVAFLVIRRGDLEWTNAMWVSLCATAIYFAVIGCRAYLLLRRHTSK